MNASFDPLHLVNTYGAFGSITRERFEIIIKGTNDEHHGDSAAWREYEFKGKPGNPARRPCIVSPYHYKLDWQMWFAAMSPSWSSPWVFDLVTKLLEGDARIIGLLESDPFPEGPPKYIRADLYRYKFTRPGDPGGNWWTREYAGEYLPATSLR